MLGTQHSVLGTRSLLLSQPLLLIEILQWLDQFADVAGHDGVELVKSQIDAVIGDAVLREVVGADAIAAVAGADEGAALFGPFLVQFLLLHFVQPAAKDAHGPLSILVLAAL